MSTVFDKPKAYEGGENYVFISYSHNSEAEIYKILYLLSNAGVRFWYDDDLEKGEDWKLTVKDKICNATAVWFFFDKYFLQSEALKEEVLFTAALNKKYCPVYYTGKIYKEVVNAAIKEDFQTDEDIEDAIRNYFHKNIVSIINKNASTPDFIDELVKTANKLEAIGQDAYDTYKNSVRGNTGFDFTTTGKEDTIFRYVSRVNLTSTDIMHDRGEVVNGFDANMYFPRTEVDGGIERFLRESTKTSNLLVVTGLLSSGKSRSVYEVLKKSDIETIALCYDSGKNYAWTLEQWKNAIGKMGKDTILCVDSISDVPFVKSSEKEEEPLENWKEIFQTIHAKGLRCIVTLAKPSQETDQSFASDFLGICRSDLIKGEGNASAAVRVVEIPEINKRDDFYLQCKSNLPGDYYSPVVGDYVNYRYCNDIWEQFKREEQAIRMFIALIITLKYNQSSRNVVPCSYLKKVYFRLAQDANIAPETFEKDYIEAYQLLENLKIIRISESKAICVVSSENSFEYIKEQLYNLLDNYHEQKLKDPSTKPEGIVAWIEPYIRRNNNLYIEKKQADLIITMDPADPALYKDAVVFTSPKNIIPVAELVRKKFDAQFFVLDEKNELKFNTAYNKQMADVCDTVGVIISRTCRTSDGVKKDLNRYLEAGVEIHEDIICELLRIATEEDVTTENKRLIRDYAIKLANKQFGNETADGVTHLLTTSQRFNTSYESVCNDYDSERIKHGFKLEADNLRTTFELVQEKFDLHQENQLEEKSGKTYQKLWNSATRSLFYYCRKLTERLRSMEDLRALMAILRDENIKKRCVEIDYELRYINQHIADRSFVFMSALPMSNVAKTVLSHNPMGYIDECKEMTVELFENLGKPEYRYAYNAQSVFYFVGAKEDGVMGIIPDFNNASDFYKKLREALYKTGTNSPHLAKALNIWLYPLLEKIKKEEHLQKAKELILTPTKMKEQQKMQQETIVGNRKLINTLIKKAPSYKLACQIYEEYESIVGKRIDTINILLGHIKKTKKIKNKKKYIKLTHQWIDILETIEWNKFLTDAGRANSILTSIKEKLQDQELTERILTLEFPSENAEQKSRLNEKLNAIKNRSLDCFTILKHFCRYYNSAQGKDIYEDSDLLTHLIKYSYEDQKEKLSQDFLDDIYTMINGDDFRLPLDKLICPKEDFYKQVLLKVFPVEQYGFEARWKYIKYAYLRLLVCETLPSQRDKQADLLLMILKPISYDRPNDAIKMMETDVYDFVKEHPVFIPMYISTICLLADYYAHALEMMEDSKALHNDLMPALAKELEYFRPTPKTEDEIKQDIKDIISRKLKRINKLLLMEFEDKPLPFDEQFTISISITNKKVKDYIGSWFVKGPYNTFIDKTRHKAWDCYIEGKNNIDYTDLLPKIMYSEVMRICKVMAGLSNGTWQNFEYLKKELTLLKEKSPEKYAEGVETGINNAYTNLKNKYPDQTKKWSDDAFAQFSSLCNTKEDLDIWNALRP